MSEPSSQELYMLNVGGTVYPVLRKYLKPTDKTITFKEGNYHDEKKYNDILSKDCKVDDGLLVLGKLWDVVSDPNALKDRDGNFVVDSDAILFRYILNFVRTGRFYFPQEFSEFSQLQAELDALGMNIDLRTYLNQQLKTVPSCGVSVAVKMKWPHAEY